MVDNTKERPGRITESVADNEKGDAEAEAEADTEEQRIDGIFDEEIDAYLAAHPGVTFSLEARRRLKERTRARMRDEKGDTEAETDATRPVAEVRE